MPSKTSRKGESSGKSKPVAKGKPKVSKAKDKPSEKPVAGPSKPKGPAKETVYFLRGGNADITLSQNPSTNRVLNRTAKDVPSHTSLLALPQKLDDKPVVVIPVHETPKV